MISKTLFALLFLPIYVVLMTFVGYIAMRKRRPGDVEDYFIAKREMGFLTGLLTNFATFESGVVMLGFLGFVYTFGFSVVISMMMIPLTVGVWLWLFGSRFWAIGKELGYISPIKMISDYYNSRFLLWIIAISFPIFFTPYIVAQVMASGFLFKGVTAGVVPYWAGALFLSLTLIIYVWMGGFRAVVWTDTIQGLFFFCGVSTTGLFVCFKFFGGIGPMLHHLYEAEANAFHYTSYGGLDATGLALAWIFLYGIMWALQPEFIRRAYAVRSLKTLRYIVLTLPVLLFLGYFFMQITALGCKLVVPGIKVPGEVLPTFWGKYMGFGGVIIAGAAVAAFRSTADSVGLTTGTAIASDLYQTEKRDATFTEVINVGRYAVSAVIIASFLLSLKRIGFLVIIGAIPYGFFACFIWPVIGMLWWDRGGKMGAIACIITAFVVNIAVKSLGLKFIIPAVGLDFVLWSVPLSGIAYFVGSLLSSPVPRERVEKIKKALQKHGLR